MRLRPICCSGRAVFIAAKPPLRRIRGYSMKKPMTERSSISSNTLSSRVVSRPAWRFFADGPNTHTFQTKGRAVDGGLAQPDADRGGGRPRDHARTQRVRADGAALGHRLFHAVPPDPP